MRHNVLLAVLALTVMAGLFLGGFTRGSPVAGQRAGVAFASSDPSAVATIRLAWGAYAPWDVAVNPTTSRIYVANWDDTVPVIEDCPDGSCGGSPPHHIVLFIQGGGSQSNCDDDAVHNYNRISWLKDYLKSKSELGLTEDHFLYYDYTSGDDTPAACANTPLPRYAPNDAHFSLDQTYLDGGELKLAPGDPQGLGQGRRLARFIHNYFAQPEHANDRITIIGHSQGGVLAAYASTFPDLTPEDLAKIQAIVTLDSPLGGLWGAGAWACEEANRLFGLRLGPVYDSATDMGTGKQVSTRLAGPTHPAVPLFTVDGLPGNFFDIELVDDEHSRLRLWETAHLSVEAPGHGDVWDGPLLSGGRLSDPEASKLKEFVYCAIAGLEGCASYAHPQTLHVPMEDIVVQDTPVSEGSAKLRTRTAWNGSTIKTTLLSPTGRRIDEDTVAEDVIHFAEATSETFEVTAPEPGTWIVELYGFDVPPEGEDADLSVVLSPDAAHDTDGDGVFDSGDNCPGVSNPSQSDLDQDGLGDACDLDADSDGVPNTSDNCPLSGNADQADSDQNGLGDACDPGGVADYDSDGLVDNRDNCPFNPNPGQTNSDGDASGDVCDLDDDNDGVLDSADNCPLAYNVGQENADAACIPNGTSIAGDCRANPDKDTEGDACDQDDDNDGLADVQEATGCGSAPTDPLKTDTDGDRAIDGYECRIATDPTNPAQRPRCTSSTDSDGDGFTDCVEEMSYGTSPNSTDTDGDSSGNDGCRDDKQIVDVNGDGQANILDVFAVARIALTSGPFDPVSRAVADLNKDGANNILDPLLAAKNSTLVEPHAPC